MLKRFFNLGLISLIGITISGCGAVIKLVFKTGFKALTKNSDDVVISGDFIYYILSVIALGGTGIGSSILGSMAYTSLKDKNK